MGYEAVRPLGMHSSGATPLMMWSCCVHGGSRTLAPPGGCRLQPRGASVRLLYPWGSQLNSRKSSVFKNGNRRLSGVFSMPRYRRSAL